MPAENSYGWRKRFTFVAETIEEIAPARVLDVGCGTGIGLTLPLAEAYPGTQFLGFDRDLRSIRQAQQNPHPSNLRFSETEPTAERQFDLVIASEVLEHVEDAAQFVVRLHRFVRPAGRLVITVPNGYGPFEGFALIEVLLNLSGIQRLVRRLKRATPPPTDDSAPTLSISPHVNFFSRRALLRLFDSAGMRLRRCRPTTFLCGYLIDSLIRNQRAIAWNARIADRLPPTFASDWMFELEPREDTAAAAAVQWRRNAYGRLRRYLNRRRWGLA